MRRSDWGVAARLWKRLLDRDPGLADIWVQYGHALKEQGRHGEAEAAYREALRLEPGAADTHLQLGHVLKLMGRKAEALGAYVASSRIAPKGVHAARELQVLRAYGPPDGAAKPRRQGSFEPYVNRGYQVGPYAIDMWITDPTAARWYGARTNDLPEVMWCLAHMQPGMLVADCGAHHGCMTVAFAKAVGPTGHVFAWEALPKNADVIQANAELNGCRNITVRPYGVGAENATVRFFAGDGGDTVLSHERGFKGEQIEIECVRLDDEIARVDFLKLDVEGADLQAMTGAQRVLSQRPIIDLEIHNIVFRDRRDTLERMFAILDPLRYAYSLLPTPRAPMELLGWSVNLAELAKYDNPHLFCLPVWG